MSGTAAPRWLNELSSPVPGPHPPISSLTAEYDLSWKGTLRAGRLDLQFAPPGENKAGSTVFKSTASSLGPVALIYPYQHSYWSEVLNRSLLPAYFKATERDYEEHIETVNRYTGTVTKTTETTRPLKSSTSTTNEFTFSHGPARDLFSAFLFLRSQELRPGSTYSLLLIPFKSAYILRARVEAKEKHRGQNAIRLSMSLQKIDRKTLKLVKYEKLKRPLTLWLSDDLHRIPLEIRASVFIGDVRATLKTVTIHQL